MPKTPDEIKEAMLHCSPVSCRSTGCPYKADTPKYEGDMPVCRMKLWHDMRHLIQQLESERDAAVADMRQASIYLCCACKKYHHAVRGVSHHYCEVIGERPDFTGAISCGMFEWRGVQKEDEL